ncbi:MAG: hypothetical protein J6S89_07870, partial [Paludibacteraceae bacterium]|nr:hypothetical protein [Paludibacteraceae bacterium]
MKVYINGLKDGHENFYPGQKPREFDVLKDERSMSGGSAKGEYLYSIAMTYDGCIFSKYYGIYSIPRRDYGYIAFSVFIDNRHKLSGKELKNLLDELSRCYLERYVVDWKLDNCREDWGFVDEIVEKFDKYIKPLSEVLRVEPSQNLTNAYMYCQNDNELEQCFDNPCQSEYEPYRQVFLLEQQNENLLNLLKHDSQANLTGKIDFENPRYKLILRQDYSHSGLDVEVRANGKRKYNEDWVYRKEKLTITYSKKYCDTLVLEGKITDAELQPYLEIEEDNRRIIVKRDVDLKPASTKIKIVVTDIKERRVEDVEIKVLPQGVNPMRKTPENDGGYVFVGEELGETFTVIANKNGLSGSKTFVPNQVKENVISLIIQKRKLINITILDDKNGLALYGCNITVKDKKNFVEKKSIIKDKFTYEFLGDEIGKEFIISVYKHKYKPEEIIICPEDVDSDPYYIGLIQQEEKRIDGGQPAKQYRLVIDEKEGYRDGIPDYETNINRIPNIKPKARKGFRFVKWEDHKDQSYDLCDGHFIAIFEETWWHKHKGKVLLAAIAVLLVALIVLVISLVRGKNPQPPKNEETFAHVIDSIKVCGDNLDMLSALQDRWQQQEPGIVKTGGFWGIGGTPDSTIYKAWAKGMEEIETAIKKEKEEKNAAEKLRQEIKDYVEGNELFYDKLTEFKGKLENDKNKLENDESLMKRLDSCIQLRSWLNQGSTDYIKGYNFHYSSKQQKLISAINSISSDAKAYVNTKMSKASISAMTLDEIADFIISKSAEGLRLQQQQQ